MAVGRVAKLGTRRREGDEIWGNGGQGGEFVAGADSDTREGGTNEDEKSIDRVDIAFDLGRDTLLMESVLRDSVSLEAGRSRSCLKPLVVLKPDDGCTRPRLNTGADAN